MRFLFITHTAAPSGAEMRLARLVRGLAPEASVLTLEDGPLVATLRAQGTPVRVLPLSRSVQRIRREDRALAAVRALPQLARLIPALAAVRAEFEVTAAFSQKAFVAAALSQPLVRRPLIWGLNDIISGEHFSAPLRKLVVALAKLATCQVVVNSRAAGDAFLAAGGSTGLVRVIHPGTDLTAFRRTAHVPDRNLPARLVGSFGRLAPWKGQDVLLRAAARLPQLQVWIVGGAQFGEGAYEARLKRLAVELGLGERVRFFGHRDDVPALMAACDLIAHTSVAPEPFGQVIVEAMAARKPVVAAAAGGVLEIVEHGVNGLLVPPRDATALAEALARLLHDPDLRVRLADAAEHTAATFSTAAMTEAWAACLKLPQRPATAVPFGQEARPSRQA